MSPRQEKARTRQDTRTKASRRSAGSPEPPSRAQEPSQQQASRLEQLYEINKLFVSFENAAQPLDPALAIVTQTLPLQSAMLIEIYDDRSRTIVWPTLGQSAEQVQAIKDHAEAACAYLVGATSSEAAEHITQAGTTRLPWRTANDDTLAGKLIVLPLVVASRRPFGILQLESAQPFDRADLKFVNAIANQLAIALDRDHAWQRDIKLRALAEEGRVEAEMLRAAAERDRIIAVEASEKNAALATDNAKLYEQAQQAVRAREQILAVVSHDLKSFLGTILLTTGMLESSQQSDPQPQRFAQAVRRIHRVAESMLRLIKDLLDFASIDAGHLAIHRRPQDPRALIDETLASFAVAAQAKQLRLTSDLALELPLVHCDRDRILQVLFNLIGNAIHVTLEGGQITLRVEARGRELLFAVEDDGPGISEEDRTHLFDRYWRSGRAAYAGNGLGLAIASEIVSAHGGELRVESELGRGTCFLFALSASEDDGVSPVLPPRST